MKVLVVENGYIQEREIDNNLKEYQKIVGGLIDIITRNVSGKEYDFILNDEGKLIGLDTNVLFDDDDYYDEVAGNVIICKSNNEGETIGLTDEDIKHIQNNSATVLTFPEMINVLLI